MISEKLKVETLETMISNNNRSWGISDYFSEHFTKSVKYPDAFSENQS
jgi:hypothetical protein